MKLSSLLFKRSIRDLVKNLKQYIAIIFIIGIAVTLFCGLESNAQSLENRVNEVYSEKNGNLGDIWITLDNDYERINEYKDEYNSIQDIVGSDSIVETRLLAPSKLNSADAYALVSLNRPTINKEYSLEVFEPKEEYIETEDDDLELDVDKGFFFVDKNIIERQELLGGEEINLGDYMSVSFASSTIKELVKPLLEDELSSNSFITTFIENLNVDDGVKETLYSYLETYGSTIQDALNENIDNVFTEEWINFDFKINGFMNHPENIQNSSFTASYYMVSTRILLVKILNKLKDQISFESIYSNIENEDIKDYLSNYEGTFDETKDEMFENIKDVVKGDSEEIDYLTYLYNQYIIKLGNSKNVDAKIDELNEYFDSGSSVNGTLGIMDRENYPSNAVIQNDIIQARQLTYVFPFIFFSVAILVVLTTITQMMLKERTQMGTMKALGLSRTTICFYYIINISIIGLIGVILGLILGPLLIPNILNIKYGILYELTPMKYVFPFTMAIIITFVVLLLMSLITYAIIFKELRETPSSSMRPKIPAIKLKNKKSKIKNISLMMALRNIRVHISKSLMVIIGVMGCTGLLICGIGIEDTLDYGINIDMTSYYDADFFITYDKNYDEGEIGNEISKIDGIDAVYESQNVSITASYNEKNVKCHLNYFDMDNPSIKFDDELEGGHRDESGVAVVESTANKLGIKVGDTISFSYNTLKFEYKVEYIFYSFSCSGIFKYIDENDDLYETFSVKNTAFVYAKDEYSDKLLELEEEILNLEGVSTARSKDSIIETMDSYISAVKYMTNTVKVFAVLLAIVVLINLSILNYQERLRDLATLKVLGFSLKEIAASLVFEIIILTIIGATLGLGMGYPFLYMVLGTNQVELVAYHYTIVPITYLIGFIISFITAIITNLIMSFKIKKIDMSESLKSVE